MQLPVVGGRRHRAEPGPAWSVVVRPRRLRWISLGAAVFILGINLFSGVTLSGTTSNGGQLFSTDRWAVAGIGAVFAALALLPWRFLVQADATRVRVRNLVGDVSIPWDVVERVRFDRKSVWASLELSNGELVPLLAVEIFDRQEAVSAARRLRNLHADFQRATRVQDPPA